MEINETTRLYTLEVTKVGISRSFSPWVHKACPQPRQIKSINGLQRPHTVETQLPKLAI